MMSIYDGTYEIQFIGMVDRRGSMAKEEAALVL